MVTKRVPACILVTAMEADVDADFYAAVSDAGLVFDGKLVIDANMRTTDPSIFAGGPAARFSRVFKTMPLQMHANTAEVGARLAEALLERIDPLGGAADDEWATQSMEPPKPFIAPRGVSAVLPGGYNYVHIKVPRQPFRSIDLTTDNPKLPDAGKLSPGFTKLVLDVHGRVAELLYIGLEPVEERNLAAVVGLHEAFLRGAKELFEGGAVGDWISFFRQEWATALYHASFKPFLDTLRAMLAEDEGSNDVVDHCLRVLRDRKEGGGAADGADGEADFTCFDAMKTRIGPGGSELMESTKKMIEVMVVEYIKRNRYTLPKYALPEKR